MTDEAPRRDLIQLKTRPKRDAEFIVELCEDILARAKEGKIEQIFVVWSDERNELNVSRFAKSIWSMIGMVSDALQQMINLRA